MNTDTHTDEFDGRPELIKKRAQTILLQRVAIGIILIFMLASMTVLVYNAVQSIATRHVIIDCTDPAGDCYGEGQKRTGAVIQELIDANNLGEIQTRHIVIIAISCADQKPEASVNEVEVCVNEQLAREKKEKQ